MREPAELFRLPLTALEALQIPVASARFIAEGKARGFPVEIVSALEDEGRPVSSGTIRAALSAGQVIEAAELLGYPWFVSAEVVHGDKRGRELGFPTANLRTDAWTAVPADGVYAGRVLRLDEWGRTVPGGELGTSKSIMTGIAA